MRDLALHFLCWNTAVKFIRRSCIVQSFLSSLSGTAKDFYPVKSSRLHVIRTSTVKGPSLLHAGVKSACNPLAPTAADTI